MLSEEKLKKFNDNMTSDEEAFLQANTLRHKPGGVTTREIIDYEL